MTSVHEARPSFDEVFALLVRSAAGDRRAGDEPDAADRRRSRTARASRLAAPDDAGDDPEARADGAEAPVGADADVPDLEEVAAR